MVPKLGCLMFVGAAAAVEIELEDAAAELAAVVPLEVPDAENLA
jgi:hypothetical protein